MGPKAGLRWWVYNLLSRAWFIRRLHDVLQLYAVPRLFVGTAIALGILGLCLREWAYTALALLVAAATVSLALSILWDYGLRWTDDQ